MMQNIKSVKLFDIAVDAIDKTAEVMVDLNIEQLKKGYDSRGHRFHSYRSRRYAQMKNQMNPDPGMWHPDLILTGAFISSFSVKLQGTSIHFKASDEKAPALLKKYGDDVLGLSDEYQEYYNHEIFYPPFFSTITGFLGL